MTLRAATCIGVAFLGVAGAAPALAADFQARFHYSDDTLLSIGQYTFEGGKTLNLTVGIGSGAFRHPRDPANVIWTIGDRGANIACEEMKSIAGPNCRLQRGQERPGLSDAFLYAFDLPGDALGRWRLPRYRRDHAQGSRRAPAERMPNPLRTATTETPLDGSGKRLSPDLNGIDAEAIGAASRRFVLDRRGERAFARSFCP